MNDDIPKEMYGFKVGEIIETKINVTDENGVLLERGSRLRLVSIAPKVIVVAKDNRISGVHDSKPYFFNAVRETQESNYGDRIREDFIAIKKCEQPRYQTDGIYVIDTGREVCSGKRVLCRAGFCIGMDEQHFRAKMIAAALNQYTGRREM